MEKFYFGFGDCSSNHFYTQICTYLCKDIFSKIRNRIIIVHAQHFFPIKYNMDRFSSQYRFSIFKCCIKLDNRDITWILKPFPCNEYFNCAQFLGLISLFIGNITKLYEDICISFSLRQTLRSIYGLLQHQQPYKTR